MSQNSITRRTFALTSIALIAILATPGLVLGAGKAKTMSAPDLTVGTNRYGVAYVYGGNRLFTYTLGPTGMRGWIWTQWETYNSDTSTAGKPWQILVTSVGTNTPAAAAGILPNDVILGAQAGGGAVSVFTNSARKSLGWAIGDAEATNGILRLLINRDGVGTNQTYTLQLKLTNLAYSATAPYNCPKSARILADAVNVISNKTFSLPGARPGQAGGRHY